jgi:DNA helicase-2/ATP-dependent DNA helicase PcrA
MTTPNLAKLNPDQRRAVEHGAPDFAVAGPLLIIAGAAPARPTPWRIGWRILIVNGIDPAASCCSPSHGAPPPSWRGGSSASPLTAWSQRDGRRAALADALAWSGTFHAIGARLLREYALQIGLDRSFTIHDREDSRI